MFSKKRYKVFLLFIFKLPINILMVITFMLHLRPLTLEDIDFAFQLILRQNWDTTKSQLEDLIIYKGDNSYILEKDTKSIGMIFCTNYPDFSFIGNFIVHQEYRGRGFGTFLFKELLKRLDAQNVKTIMLDGVSNALNFYERYGFNSICKSLRLEGKIDISLDDSKIRQMELKDLEDVNKLDKIHFGTDRLFLLKQQLMKHPNYTKVMETKEGKLKGYIMAIPRGNHVFVGPYIIDPRETTPEKLLFSLPKDINLAKIGVLENIPFANKLCNQFGFKVTHFSTRMQRGRHTIQGRGMLAIAGPDRG